MALQVPTHGRVVLDTTAGDIEIELWSKEAPKACRNFLTLAMEGYYDGVIFHRVVPNFLIQTGDRTGTGGGGESFYGEPFEDEIHPRLKFLHRGLVGCANNGQKNSNDSQFFITLDRTDELNGKHTLWGRCVGDTFFNALKIGQAEIGSDERPVYPPKIRTVKIVENPFDDIVPRITAAEKRAQQKAREAAQKEREEAARRKGAKKNVGLLSFGMEGGTVEDEEPVSFQKKPIVRPDLLEDPSLQSTEALSVPEPPQPKSRKSKNEDKPAKPTPDSDMMAIREQHSREKDAVKKSRDEEIAKMESDIRKLTRRHGDSDSENERAGKKAKGPSLLEQELAKYSKGRGGAGKKGKKKDESDVLAALSSFRSKLRDAPDDDEKMDIDGSNDAKEPNVNPTDDQEGVEVDNDTEWLSHRLHFPKDNKETDEQALDHYEVIDPRARGRQAKDEEKERKQGRRGGPSKVFRPGGGR
ncbi:Peptidyl-prolyl isomerase cwc27 [Tulasnella sp. 417]|nr:Peptidyl-prolyl isomerase cwc27 [Tulasnella sp. 417]